MAKRDLQVIGEKAMWTMSVKGGKLPNGFEVFIAVEMDYTGAKRGDIITQCSGGQSIRVKLQDQLRSLPTSTLNRYAAEGYKCKFNDIYDGKQILQPKDIILSLSKDDFIDLMCEEYDLSYERAETMYNVKHGIKVEAPTE